MVTKWQPKVVEPAAPGAKLRLLIASHSHPEVTNGGAEIAAYQLFRALQNRDDIESWFLGCDRRAGTEKPGAVLTQPHSIHEYLYATNAFDWFKFANRDPRFPAEIEKLFLKIRPDVVHFHHYINFGVEIFAHLKRVLPAARIILTLHEYLAICHQFGQMVTKDHYNLCYQATPARCNSCFPAIDKSDFFLRKLYISRFLDLVDLFIAPSQFLADRYIAWGLPAERIAVVENLMPETTATPPAKLPADRTLRIGFFGQISTLKGIDVMFDAAAILAKDEDTQVSLEIFGDYRGQPPQFQDAFLARLEKAPPNLRFNGPYDRQRVNRLMQSVHAILVPSIWWENSPLVIQEALRNRRPVICSDIGGMAEKVRDGIDGYHFPAGNPVALASLIRQLAANRADLSELAANLPGAPALVAGMEDYLALYRAQAAATQPAAPKSSPQPRNNKVSQ